MSDVLTKEERKFYDDTLASVNLTSLTIRGTIFALGVIDRLCVELTRARHENDRLEASIRGNVAKIGEKHRENDALRRELAELRKPVEALPVGVADAIDDFSQASFDFGKAEERDPSTSERVNDDKQRDALEAAILKALNERGGGK